MALLTLVKELDTKQGKGYVFRTEDNFPVLVGDSALADEQEGKSKWKIGVSLCSGCGLGCRYCFTRGMKQYRPLSVEEIIKQVDFVCGLPDKNPDDYDEIKIEMKEMGDPALNPINTCQTIRKLESKYLGLLYVVSTVGINGTPLFEELKAVRNTDAKIRLQFSVHTTSDQQRRELTPHKGLMALEDIGKVVTDWCDGSSPVTLNFVPFSGYELSAEKLAQYFSPEQAFVKISYLDHHRFVEKAGFKEKSSGEVENFISELSNYGFAWAYRNRS